jgi:hypothetical protein
MANKFIGSTTDFPAVTPAGSDTVPLIQGAALKQATVANIGAVAVATHEGTSDPHPQYLTQPEADLLYAGAASPTGNSLQSGGGVAWLGDYDYLVSAAQYHIQGTGYSSAETPLTLSASDATLDRIDIIALSTSGPVILEGTLSATPAAPDVDPTTHLALTFVYVAAASTAPDADIEDIYLENTEWTSSSSGATWALASTNNPLAGTKDIEATTVAAGAYVQLQHPSTTVDLANYDNLVFYIRSKASWPAAKQLTIAFLNAGVQVGSGVTFKSGTYGFDSSVTANYQQIVIPLAVFAAAGIPVNQIRFTVAGGGGSIGFYLDNISLQGGVSQAVVGEFMRFRGAHSGTAQYQRSDVVFTGSGGTLALWVALQSNVGVTPAAGVYWERLTPSAAVVDSDDVTYTPTTLADWDGAADPGDVEQALDQLAERTADLEAGGGGDASAVTYTPAVATDWDGDADPGNVDDALDQLAERVDDLEGAGSGGASAVTYTPAVTADWDGSTDPGNVDDALDQLAERVTDVETGFQPLDSDLTTIAGLTATTDNFMVAVASAWASRTPAQAAATLQGDGLTVELVGYRGLPQVSFSANTTIAATHNGKDFYHPASDANARTVTIDSNTNLALPVGFTFSGYNDTSQAVTIAITTDTLVFAGTGGTGSRTVAQYGSWLCRKVTSTRWIISGVGIT